MEGLLEDSALPVLVVFDGDQLVAHTFLQHDHGLVRKAAKVMAVKLEIVLVAGYVHVDFEEAAQGCD